MCSRDTVQAASAFSKTECARATVKPRNNKPPNATIENDMVYQVFAGVSGVTTGASSKMTVLMTRVSECLTKYNQK